MSYIITDTTIPDLKILETKIHYDERGFFSEMYNQRDFTTSVGIECEFVQDNRSVSKKNVLRGLHIQFNPPQGKLVQVTSGSIFDVAVDLRRGSKTFGSWFGVELSSLNRKSLWIPEGFAHGFLALEDKTEVLYKVTSYYNPGSEKSIMWNDPNLSIIWPNAESVILSKRDAQAASFNDYCEEH